MNFVALLLESPDVDNLETKVSWPKTVFMVLSFSSLLGYCLIIGYDLLHPDPCSLHIPATPTYFVYGTWKEAGPSGRTI